MSLELPACAEVFIPDGEPLAYLHNPGVYALTLERPDNLADAWDREFETRPDYFEELQDAERVYYVGASADVLGRLEDHRDKDVRVAALLRVCAIQEVRNIWWYESADKAFERENGVALMLQNEHPSSYVHCR